VETGDRKGVANNALNAMSLGGRRSHWEKKMSTEKVSTQSRPREGRVLGPRDERGGKSITPRTEGISTERYSGTHRKRKASWFSLRANRADQKESLQQQCQGEGKKEGIRKSAQTGPKGRKRKKKPIPSGVKDNPISRGGEERAEQGKKGEKSRSGEGSRVPRCLEKP